MTAAAAMRREGRRQGFRKGRVMGGLEGRREARVEAVDELLRAGFGWPVIEAAIGIDEPTYRGHRAGSSASNGKTNLADMSREESSVDAPVAAPKRTLLDVLNSVTEQFRREGRLAGYRDGRRKGRIEGRREGRLEAANGLVQVGFRWPVIETATGIDEQTYHSLKGESAIDRGGAWRAALNAEPKPELPDPQRAPPYRAGSLRERMLGAAPDARQQRMYRRYGVLDNPFPSAGHRAGPPRLEDAADAAVADRFRRFERCGYDSHAIMIEGAPWRGKGDLARSL